MCISNEIIALLISIWVEDTKVTSLKVNPNFFVCKVGKDILKFIVQMALKVGAVVGVQYYAFVLLLNFL